MADFNDKHDETLTLIEEMEAAIRRMIVGVFRFVFVRFPAWILEILNHFFEGIIRGIQYLFQLTIRLIRLAFFVSIWALLIFAPLAATLYWSDLDSPVLRGLAVGWSAIGLIGSAWGLRRWSSQKAIRFDDDDTRPRPASGMVGFISWIMILGCIGVVGWGSYSIYHHYDTKDKAALQAAQEKSQREAQELADRELRAHRDRALGPWPKFQDKHYPIVTFVEDRSLADELGLREGDMYISYNGHDLAYTPDTGTVIQFVEEAGQQGNDRVEAVFVRDGLEKRHWVKAGQKLGVMLNCPKVD